MLCSNLHSIIGPSADHADGARHFNARNCCAPCVENERIGDRVDVALDGVSKRVQRCPSISLQPN
jgi:hypothetical protein